MLSGLEFAGGYLTLLPTVTMTAVSLLFFQRSSQFFVLGLVLSEHQQTAAEPLHAL